jgi:PKD repeat protein
MNNHTRTRRVIAALGVALVTLVAGLPAAGAVTPPPVESSAAHVTSDALPTVQINGVVWDQAIIGDTVYAVGEFTSARPAGSAPGQNEVARSNILAYRLSTGQLISSFAPTLDRQGKTVTASPDGSRIYVGGSFTVVNGVNHYRIVALDATTGAAITTFNAKVDYTVNAIVATNTTVYAGGGFSQSGGVARSRLAAFTASTGALTAWNPNADNTVNAMVMLGSRVFVGGSFKNVGGAPAYGLAAIDADTGALLSWGVTSVVRDAGATSAILTLDTDGTSIFGGGFTFGRVDGNLEGVFSADPITGAIKWIEDCHGDTYSIVPANGYVYVANHAHYCGNAGGYPQTDPWSINMHRTLSFTTGATGTLRREPWGYYNFEGRPAPSLVHWFPDWTPGTYTGEDQAARSLTANANYLVAGGEFLKVNGTPQQGLVRFAVPQIAPNADGPLLSGNNYPINARSDAPGEARISFPANVDRDTRVLNYRITRNGQTVYTTQAASNFWDRPIVGFVDRGLTPGQTYTYHVFVDDGHTTRGSPDTSVTIATSGDPSPYADHLMADGARTYWRLDNNSGGTTRDELGFDDGTVGSAVTFGAAGALTNENSTAATFTTSTSSIVNSTNYIPAPDTFTEEAWIRTSSNSGGRIVGFGSSATGTSSSPDRHLYMTNNGSVTFGVQSPVEGPGPGLGTQRRTIASQTGLNNNQWHYVVGTLDYNGMRLYVDGVQVASRSDVNTGRGVDGYWRVGNDTLSGWPNRPTANGLAGQIDEVAIYANALTPAQIADHYAASGRGQASNLSPTASYTFNVNQLTASFNASLSNDPDGTISSYAWNFGDGTNGSGVTPSHTYAAAGDYTVTLTVTDNKGATDQLSRTVTAVAPPANVPPTAAFTTQILGRSLSANGSSSSDSDGTIASYSWNFGDGTSGSGVTTSHTYATAGQYTVTLTVTDNDGATDNAAHSVTATNDPVTVASDTFSRTVSGGLGTADVGGAWVLGGSAGDFAVNGGQARINLPSSGAGRTATLPNATAVDTDMRMDVSLDKVPTGTGAMAMVSTIARSAAGSDYRLRLRVTPTGGSLQLLRVQNFTTTVVATATLQNFVYTAGSVIHMRFQAIGTAPTALAGKAWIDGQAEPAAWQITATDATAGLQQAGAVGVHATLSGTVTNTPVVVSIDNLVAQAN